MPHHHPYYPVDLQIPGPGGYQPNTLAVPVILAGFFGACAVLVALALYLAGNKKHLGVGGRWTVVWFMLCGCIHTFFEGYFVYNHRTIAADNHWFGQAWKEYALADSRYLVRDATVLGIEGLTAIFKGPASFWMVYALLNNKAYRYALQFLVSFGQLYGCILYYVSSALDGFRDSHPAPQYFYGYFILMNLPWIIVPLVLIRQTIVVMNRAITATTATTTKTTATTKKSSSAATKKSK